MTEQTLNEIQNNPKYIELVSKRSRFAWTLTFMILSVYFCFILLIAFSPETLGAKIGDSMMTVGIPVGIGIIVFAFILTGVYVKRANDEFDTLLADVKKEVNV